MESSSTSAHIGFPGLLTIVFVIFKLLDKLDWSWWWVFSPLWISAGIGILVLIICVIIGIIFALID